MKTIIQKIRKKITTKSILIIALSLPLLSLSHPDTWAADAPLSWNSPTTNTDGTPLTDLAGYKVYYGTTSSAYTQMVNVEMTSTPTTPTYTVTNLAAGSTYYFAVTAYDSSGNESRFSNEVSKTITNTTTTTTRPTTTTTTRSTSTTTTTVKPTTSTTTTTTTTTTIPAQLPSADALTISNITTAPGITQSFTATYSDRVGWQNLSDASFYIAGGEHDQWLRYNPMTNSFILVGANSNCTPGQATTISSSFLTLNCSSSTVSFSGTTLKVTFSLTPLSSFSGVRYQLIIFVYDYAKKSNGKVVGNWTVN